MFTAPFVARSDAILSRSIPYNGVPGVSLLALTREGTIIYSGLAGTLGMDDNRPINEDTVFYLSSCTNVLTAMCAMVCIDKGFISLDESVLGYLPELERQPVSQGGVLVPRQNDITLRSLLTMTAGCSNPVSDRVRSQMDAISSGKHPFVMTDKSVYLAPLDCQPGTRWAYSASLDWTGALVERLSNLTLGAFLKKYILEPCGVTDITFDITPEMKDRLVGAHFRWICGRVSPRGPIHDLDNVQNHLGGHGAYGTADALAQVLLPLINEGKHPITRKEVLSSASVKEMFREQLNEEQSMWLNKPTVANQMEVLLPDVEKQWGLGFMLTPKGMPSGRGPGSGSWNGFTNTLWQADPVNGVVMLAFAQIFPECDESFLSVQDKWERVVYCGIAKQTD
ncbi:beta-lactamase/transpeptidase-like protein [Athelia psychrophila]|uniref:Beta-lactamase/transpeptidase-like protein n=1 Tax=Athelia psychrophila TaxID=1759441 RepID=A0A166JNZ9_9AGAM|nr:beta-lactamase/transpeptidase-like protein [Fibularhizoctonia sp. CBS 109695]